MRQKERQKLIATAMEEEKQKLFCYACYRVGNEMDKFTSVKIVTEKENSTERITKAPK